MKRPIISQILNQGKWAGHRSGESVAIEIKVHERIIIKDGSARAIV